MHMIGHQYIKHGFDNHASQTALSEVANPLKDSDPFNFDPFFIQEFAFSSNATHGSCFAATSECL